VIFESSKGRVIVHLLHTLYTSGSDSKGTPILSGLAVPSSPLATSIEKRLATVLAL